MSYLALQFEKYHLFRRLVIVYFLLMYWYVTKESFDFIYYAVDKQLPASDIVLVIGAAQALMTAIVGYAFKIYSESRKI